MIQKLHDARRAPGDAIARATVRCGRAGAGRGARRRAPWPACVQNLAQALAKAGCKLRSADARPYKPRGGAARPPRVGLRRTRAADWRGAALPSPMRGLSLVREWIEEKAGRRTRCARSSRSTTSRAFARLATRRARGARARRDRCPTPERRARAAAARARARSKIKARNREQRAPGRGRRRRERRANGRSQRLVASPR